MTGVTVRSTTNVQAGAQTRLSTILHGFWLLLFVALLPSILGLIPTASLAALLVYTGYKLFNLSVIKSLREFGGKSEVAIYLITIATIVATDLLIGVAVGMGLTVAKLLYQFAHLDIRIDTSRPGETRFYLNGAATFLNLPKFASALESVSPSTELHVHLDDLHYIDHACLDLLMNWEVQSKTQGGALVIDWNTLGAMFRERRRTVRKSENESPELVAQVPETEAEQIAGAK